MEELVRCGVAAIASTATGMVYYHPAFPTGKLHLEQQGSSNKMAPQGVKRKMFVTTACAFGLAYLLSKNVRNSDHFKTHIDVLKLAGKLTFLGTALSLPTAVWQEHNLIQYLLDRGFNFVSLTTIIGVITHFPDF